MSYQHSNRFRYVKRTRHSYITFDKRRTCTLHNTWCFYLSHTWRSERLCCHQTRLKHSLNMFEMPLYVELLKHEEKHTSTKRRLSRWRSRGRIRCRGQEFLQSFCVKWQIWLLVWMFSEVMSKTLPVDMSLLWQWGTARLAERQHYTRVNSSVCIWGCS